MPAELSVIVPVYNERSTIETVIAKLKELTIPLQIVVVDNCSTDGTREILSRMNGIDKKIFQPRNMGKGTSVKTAIPYLEAEYSVIQDGDMEYNSESFYRMLALARQERADAVYGSRVLGGGQAHYASYYAGVRFLSGMINVLYGASLTDSATTYKMVRTSVLKQLPLKCSGFDLDFELTLRLCQRGCKIWEIPIDYHPRTFEQGKKIRAKDGLRALWVILREKFFS